MSPMPYSIFFHEGYAIHGTIYVSRLGNRASHGCVRLHPANAAVLFDLVRNHGMGRTTIVVSHSDYVPKPLGLRPAVSTTGEPAETTAAIPGAPAAFGRDTEHAPDHTGEAVPQPADGEPHAADGEE